jgi:hypothetical protein
LLPFSSEPFAFSSSVETRKEKYKLMILPLVLHGYKTWSLIVREEHRPKLIENRVLRRMFGPKRDELIRGRKLHNEELHNKYCSPNIIRIIASRRIQWAGHVARMGKRGMHIWFWREGQK